jgi:hypothetical protein
VDGVLDRRAEEGLHAGQELVGVREEERAQLALEVPPRHRGVGAARQEAHEIHRRAACLDVAVLDRREALLLQRVEQPFEALRLVRQHLEPDHRDARAEQLALAALHAQVHGQRHHVAARIEAARARDRVMRADRRREVEEHRRQHARELLRARDDRRGLRARRS